MKNHQLWMKENYKKVLIITSTSLVGFFLYNVVFNSPMTRSAELRLAVINFPKINAKLKNVQTKYHASRVVVFRLYSDYLDKDHGIEAPGTLSKTSIYSITADSIVTEDGVQADLPTITHLPASTLSLILNELLDRPVVHIITNDLPGNALRELFVKRNSVESLWVAIPDRYSKMAGILQIDWQHPVDEVEEAKFESQLLPDALSLSGYF